jgi:hypothetical protein
MIRIFFYLISLTLLAACSTILDGGTQEVAIEMTGAEGGICYLEQTHEYKHRVWVPSTVRIARSEDPLKLTCLAPGNRAKTIVIEPLISTSTYLNTLNAGIGGFVDFETGGMFTYPDTIVVDFTDIPAGSMPLPAYQQLFMEHPELLEMEEFRPGVPAMQRDRYNTVPQLMPRQVNEKFFSSDIPEAPASESAPMPLSDTKGATADSLTRQMNPTVFSGAKDSDTPAGFIGGTAIIGSDSDLAAHPPVPLDPSGLPPSESDASSDSSATPEESK